MMPLIMVKPGEGGSVKKVGGSAATRKHLENLGFVVGTPVRVVSEISGNMIVRIKESSIALSREMAAHILV